MGIESFAIRYFPCVKTPRSLILLLTFFHLLFYYHYYFYFIVYLLTQKSCEKVTQRITSEYGAKTSAPLIILRIQQIVMACKITGNFTPLNLFYPHNLSVSIASHHITPASFNAAYSTLQSSFFPLILLLLSKRSTGHGHTEAQTQTRTQTRTLIGPGEINGHLVYDWIRARSARWTCNRVANPLEDD